jgi:hypothetical protein
MKRPRFDRITSIRDEIFMTSSASNRLLRRKTQRPATQLDLRMLSFLQGIDFCAFVVIFSWIRTQLAWFDILDESQR